MQPAGAPFDFVCVLKGRLYLLDLASISHCALVQGVGEGDVAGGGVAGVSGGFGPGVDVHGG